MDDQQRRRRAEHRAVWLELTFEPMPDDPCLAVVELWSAGGTSTAMAAEILDVDVAGLVRLAGELGLPLHPGVSMTVAPAGLPDSVIERLQRLADEYPEET